MTETYDTAGDKVTQTDQNGHTTDYAYVRAAQRCRATSHLRSPTLTGP